MKNNKNQGLILPYILLILLILSWLMMASFRQNSTESITLTRQADAQLARYHAEGGLREADLLIQSWQHSHQKISFTAHCHQGLCSNGIHEFETEKFISTGLHPQAAWLRESVFPHHCPSHQSKTRARAAHFPKTHFIIEYLDWQAPKHLFRITVRACGKQSHTDTFIQKLVWLESSTP